MDWIDKKEFDNEISWTKKHEIRIIKDMKKSLIDLILSGTRKGFNKQRE